MRLTSIFCFPFWFCYRGITDATSRLGLYGGGPHGAAATAGRGSGSDQDRLDVASIAWPLPELIWTLRGLAGSATGIRKVSTPWL